MSCLRATPPSRIRRRKKKKKTRWGEKKKKHYRPQEGWGHSGKQVRRARYIREIVKERDRAKKTDSGGNVYAKRAFVSCDKKWGPVPGRAQKTQSGCNEGKASNWGRQFR